METPDPIPTASSTLNMCMLKIGSMVYLWSTSMKVGKYSEEMQREVSQARTGRISNQNSWNNSFQPYHSQILKLKPFTYSRNSISSLYFSNPTFGTKLF